MNSSLNKQLITLSILILVTVFFVYTRSFKNDVPSCDGYVINVYLYVLLSLLILAFSVIFIAKRRYPITSTKSLLAFVVGLGLLFLLFTTPPRNVLLNHALWILFIISMSVGMYIIWKYTKLKGTLTSTLISTLLLIAGLTILAHYRPDLISLGWGSSLMIALSAGILAMIIPMLFNIQGMALYYKILSAIFVVIFSFLILYDTKILREKAKTCTITGVPDYPKDSLALFLDAVNLFNN